MNGGVKARLGQRPTPGVGCGGGIMSVRPGEGVILSVRPSVSSTWQPLEATVINIRQLFQLYIICVMFYICIDTLVTGVSYKWNASVAGLPNFFLSDRWIVYTKSRKQLLHRKYLLYETGCMLAKVTVSVYIYLYVFLTWMFFI